MKPRMNPEAENWQILSIAEQAMEFPAPLVMIIDDEICILRFLKSMLERRGIQTISMLWSEYALAAFKRQQDQVHMVITDMGLADPDGLELAREMRALAPEMPILLTSTDVPGDFRGSLPEFPIIHKPFRLTDFNQVFEPMYVKATEQLLIEA